MNRCIPLLLLLLTFVGTTTLIAQNEKVTNVIKCYTVESTEQLRSQHPNMQTKAEFENWMTQKLQERRDNPSAERRATYTIPYVVHVVHAGQAIGTGPNITAAAVNAQIQQINDDFRRENSDVGNTPADFVGVAAGFDVEFVPAVVDPDGNIMSEPGINRVDGNAEFGVSGTWSQATANATLKPGTIWDRNLYMNVWSADLSGGLLGYAQFPEMSTLPGMPGGGTDQTDGVVCAYGTLGSLALPGPAGAYGLGRTLTHELGHWAGLRHIWGDNDGTDYCDDTPCQGGPNYTGEPCTYPGNNSCTDPGTDLPDMFQNYMDYSDDPCFNLFTADQVGRIEVVFANSPGRNDLLTSTVWQFPNPDTIIANIDQDVLSGCSPVTVNFTDDSYEGESAIAINSWEWNFDVDGLGGATPATFSGQAPPAVTFTNVGTYTISLSIDNGVYTGEATTTVTVEGSVSLDVVMGFETGIPATWTNDLWQESSTVGSNSSASIFQDNYSPGREPGYISTPSIDMDVTSTTIGLTFDVAHAHYGSGYGEEEGLAIEVSTDCGDTWTEIWKRLDSDADPFYTTQSTEDGWEPTAEDWRTEEIDLTAYKGNSNVRVRFHGINDYGNDTYIDNINISGVTVDPATLEAEFETDADVVCAGQDVIFNNTSTVGADITDAVYEWIFDLNGTGAATPATFTGDTPSAVSFGTSGVYTIQLTVSSAAQGTSDVFTLDLEVGGALSLPFAEDFESGVFPPVDWDVEDGWLAGAGFQSANGIYADNYNEEDLIAGLMMPSLDFSAVGLATLSFDISHTYYAGLFGNLYDTLQISYSLDCGATWTALWRKDDGNALDPLYTVDGGSGSEFFPASDDDWRHEEIDVTFLQGNDNVKFSFQNRGGFANSLFLDNINVDAELVDPDEVFAYFVADATAGCAGSAINFTDQSTAGANTEITSWEWNFDLNGTGTANPTTFSGQEPPAVLFEEGGIYGISLTVSDGVASDDYVTQISIEVPEDLTYTQDFSAASFPPTGWTNALWEQAAESTDPLLGSLFANNYGIAGLQARAQTPSFDMSWYDQIAMEFDVSHARFSLNENEGLVINYSTDCSLTWTEVWSKYDYDADPLYTHLDTEGGAFFPTGSSDWREEVVDLSTLNDYSSVKLEIYNDGAYGNNTFVDDIVIEGWLFNPTDLTASLVGTNNIELSWTDNSGKETAYDVMRWNAGTMSFDVIATLDADASSYTDAGLSGPAEYTYQVCAYNEKARACSDSATDSTEAVLEIGGLIAIVSDQSGTSIELYWDDLSTTEDGFLIKRSEDDFATYEVINMLTPDQNYYLDEFLDETTTYTYQVCAFNTLDTVESNTDDATTEINAPSELTATAVDNNIALSWTDNSLVEEGFQIKRSLTTGGPYATIATVGANVTAYTDFDLLASTEYCYIVCAFNTIAVGCSDEECEETGFITSISEELSNAINIYPNPASDYFELQLGSIQGDIKMKIYNQIGEVMTAVVLSGGSLEKINVNDFAAGVYMIRLENEEGFTTKKLVVE